MRLTILPDHLHLEIPPLHPYTRFLHSRASQWMPLDAAVDIGTTTVAAFLLQGQRQIASGERSEMPVQLFLYALSVLPYYGKSTSHEMLETAMPWSSEVQQQIGKNAKTESE